MDNAINVHKQKLQHLFSKIRYRIKLEMVKAVPKLITKQNAVCNCGYEKTTVCKLLNIVNQTVEFQEKVLSFVNIYKCARQPQVL
jgi:hypothetical protein